MRVRFAPSPTGVLHIGGARTALYNWLLARGSGGEFVLRIEDTDRERSTPENVEQILDALRWLELDWDEGPISQAERARPPPARRSSSCSTSGARLRGRGRRAPARARRGRDHLPRRRPRRRSRIPHSAIKDFVIQRSDGSPLYNLAVAVDDRDMGITHVVRGEDHVSNTPRQLMILRGARRRAAGVRAPAAAPRPRRQEALEAPRRGVGAGAARRRATCPRRCATTSRCSAGATTRATTFITTDELVERFALERVSKNPAVFDEQKLRWMNGRYLRELPVEELHRAARGVRPAARSRSRPSRSRQEKMQTLADFWPLAGSLVERPADYDEKAWRQ